MSSTRETCDKGSDAPHNTNQVDGSGNVVGKNHTVANANVPIHVHVYTAGSQSAQDSFTAAERELIHIVRGLAIDGQLQIYKAAKAASTKRTKRARGAI